MTDSRLERRVAFWDNMLWKLHQLERDVEAEMANKWVMDDDTYSMELVLSYLRKSEYTMITRYQEVLRDKLAAMKAEMDV